MLGTLCCSSTPARVMLTTPCIVAYPAL
jgi:hypothetical protein